MSRSEHWLGTAAADCQIRAAPGIEPPCAAFPFYPIRINLYSVRADFVPDAVLSGNVTEDDVQRYCEERLGSVLSSVLVTEHAELADVWRASFGLPDDEDMSEITIGGETESGAEIEMTLAEHIEAATDSGGFGFADTLSDPPRVHVWHPATSDAQDKARLIGHELGHLVGEKEADERAEERRAESYGAVAEKVIGLLFGSEAAERAIMAALYHHRTGEEIWQGAYEDCKQSGAAWYDEAVAVRKALGL